MDALYENVFRPILFRKDPESAHDAALGWMRLLGRAGPLLSVMRRYNRAPGKPVELFGLTFANPVGIAAGMDKNGTVWPVFASLGFGHAEIGTVTRHEQDGNPKPRVFRYPEQEGLVNRMGFPNEGAEKVEERLKHMPQGKKRPLPLGINIGKSRSVNLEDAAQDCGEAFDLLAEYADFVTINVSSPNTPELRQLQQRHELNQLLGHLQEKNRAFAQAKGGEPRPLLVKVAPDLTYQQLDDVLAVAEANSVSGVVATNTSVSRPEPFPKESETGGLSGGPLHQRSVDFVDYIHRAMGGKLPVIGVGGIMDEASAGAMFDAGASLIQIYTGFVYRGPFFGRTLARAASWRSRDWL